MITCFNRYELDLFKIAAFGEYARNLGAGDPAVRILIGYSAPHEGSATTAYAAYNIDSLVAYEAYRARLRDDPLGRANYEFARRERFVRTEERIFLRLASAPHSPLVRP